MKLLKLMMALMLCLGLDVLAASAKTPANTLVVADAIDDVISLDPGEVSEVGGVLTSNQIYQPLVSFDVNDPTKIVGVLAESWSISADGKIFTFKMNPKAKFASGNPVTARDAEYSLRRVVLMKSRSAFIITQFGFTPENVKDRIKAADDQTLVIEIGDRYAPSFLFYCLSSYVGGIVDSKLVSEHEVKGDFGNAWLKSEHSAGSGPFELVKWEPKKSILLKRNENFWGTRPGVERIFIQHVAESATQRLLLEKGDIDVANKLGSDDFDAIKDNAGVKVITSQSGTIYYMGLNVRNPYLAKPKVVEALKYLVDYQGIAATISRGAMKVHQTLVPDGFLGALDYTPYKLDVEKAKALLKEAGVTSGFSLDTVVWNSPPYTDWAQAIQATMAEAGIKLNLQVVDGQQWLDRYRSHKLDIWLGLWGPDYPDPHSNAKAFAVNKQDAPDGSESLADRFGWNAGELSKQAMAAVREQDTLKRKAMYQDLQKTHTDTSPFIYMFQEVRRVGVNSKVKGVVLGLTFSDDRYWSASKD
ncbi:ABC transporter substrate-binding protein [Mesorhizobium koreense]|uniref:ABC transporter substrate-binding protein n=1 Tax=Mesorhizobium koreense TaxID=3074855 RepID=UPI00287B6155|nr:ABC transporter substrate-binding protein [Mesorhizobium sp. WR6]